MNPEIVNPPIIMRRFTPVTDPQTVQELEGIARKLRLAVTGVPNFIRLLAQSPATLRAYARAEAALSKGQLPSSQREEIALAVAEINGSDYCLEFHQQGGRRAGLSDDEVGFARKAAATDSKTRVMLRFVQAVVLQRGEISDDDYVAVRRAGFSEAEIIEILANVSLNIFTNYFNILARTESDCLPSREICKLLAAG